MGMPSPGAVPPALYDPSWMQAAVGAHLMMQNAAARAEMAALHHGHHPYPPPWSAMGAFPPVDFMPPNELLLPGGWRESLEAWNGERRTKRATDQRARGTYHGATQALQVSTKYSETINER